MGSSFSGVYDLIEKNHRFWHRSDQAEWECDCMPDALIRPLAAEFPVFRLVCGPLQRRVGANGIKAGLIRRAVTFESLWSHRSTNDDAIA
jgi:hypothetical protein